MIIIVTCILSIQKQDPLKQGLKHFGFNSTYLANDIQKQDPLKQGLKQDLGGSMNIYAIIQKQDPLKQGLKPESINLCV